MKYRILLLTIVLLFSCSIKTEPDYNFQSYADTTGVTVSGLNLEPPEGTDDTLKLSHVSNALITGCTIYGGEEDCIDINRECNEIIIRDCELFPRGGQAITIKGGSHGIVLENVVIHPGASNCDIELGQYAHTGHEKTFGISLINVTRSDGEPVHVKVWNAELPLATGSEIYVTYISPLIWIPYFWGRDTGIW